VVSSVLATIEIGIDSGEYEKALLEGKRKDSLEPLNMTQRQFAYAMGDTRLRNLT
jgi:hypothetical protein